MTISTPKKRTVKKAAATQQDEKPARTATKKRAPRVAEKKAATTARKRTTTRTSTRATKPKAVKRGKAVKKIVAEPHECFWINNGAIVKDLDELAREMQHMSDEQFIHHVRNDQNDFARWVAEVFGELALARKLARARTRDSARRVVVAHVSLRG